MNFASLEAMQFLCQTHMTVRHAAIMEVVYSGQQPKNFSDIRNILKITGPALSRAICFLMEKKMVRSQIGETDRRKLFVYRTPEGDNFMRVARQ